MFKFTLFTRASLTDKSTSNQVSYVYLQIKVNSFIDRVIIIECVSLMQFNTINLCVVVFLTSIKNPIKLDMLLMDSMNFIQVES